LNKLHKHCKITGKKDTTFEILKEPFRVGYLEEGKKRKYGTVVKN
jgi:hypothetical protein